MCSKIYGSCGPLFSAGGRRDGGVVCAFWSSRPPALSSSWRRSLRRRCRAREVMVCRRKYGSGGSRRGFFGQVLLLAWPFLLRRRCLARRSEDGRWRWSRRVQMACWEGICWLPLREARSGTDGARRTAPADTAPPASSISLEMVLLAAHNALRQGVLFVPRFSDGVASSASSSRVEEEGFLVLCFLRVLALVFAMYPLFLMNTSCFLKKKKEELDL